VGETSAPAPTAAPASETVTNTSSGGTSQCANNITSASPNLFEIRTTKDTATLYYAPPLPPYSSFYVAYSQTANVWQYGTQFNQETSNGVLKFTINKLAPNTKYYFKMRAGNGCAAGIWGNTMTAATTNSTKQKTYYKNAIVAISQTLKSFVSKIIPVKTTTISVTPTPVPTSVPVLTSQPEVTSPPAIQVTKKKFCILWWCF
jgi:hypothetical protein